MANTTHQIWNLLDKDPPLRRDLSRGLLNIRAVAHFLTKNYNLDSSTHAIISAIRRYPNVEDTHLKNSKISEVLKNSRIATKTRIISISLNREKRSLEILQKIIPMIAFGKGEVLRFSEGREKLKILIDQHKKEDVLKIIPHDLVVGTKENLGELSINFGDGSGTTIGVLATIMTEIALKNINIIEAISCFPEYMIFVEEKDLLKAYEVLLNFL